jgi:hypothetical protein
LQDSDLIKPINNFGMIIITIGLLGLCLHIFMVFDPDYTIDFQVFVIVLSCLHLLGGLGVFLKTKYGWYALKIYLYSLYFMVPIGTYIAIKTLKYIKQNNIEKFFNG